MNEKPPTWAARLEQVWGWLPHLQTYDSSKLSQVSDYATARFHLGRVSYASKSQSWAPIIRKWLNESTMSVHALVFFTDQSTMLVPAPHFLTDHLTMSVPAPHFFIIHLTMLVLAIHFLTNHLTTVCRFQPLIFNQSFDNVGSMVLPLHVFLKIV